MGRLSSERKTSKTNQNHSAHTHKNRPQHTDTHAHRHNQPDLMVCTLH